MELSQPDAAAEAEAVLDVELPARPPTVSIRFPAKPPET